MASSNDRRSLLVAGGNLDPNLSRLVEIAESLGISVCDLRYGTDKSLPFSWQLGRGSPTCDDRVLNPHGAFIRYDVFGAMNDPRSSVSHRASAWYQAIYGWLLSDPEIRLFNRHALPLMGNKPAMLVLGQQLGLTIPETCITNEARELDRFLPTEAIAKPVAGGDYCYSLAELRESVQFRDGCTATPAIVQNRLVPPEVRIYIIGDRVFAFEVRSPHLDYRTATDAQIIPLATVPSMVKSLKKLMAALQMNFGAADFKTDPQAGDLVFLELNSSPMFVGFDRVLNGKLCAAIVRELVD